MFEDKMSEKSFRILAPGFPLFSNYAEKMPWLWRKKQGPLLRKRAMVKHMVPYALIRLIVFQEEAKKKVGSTAAR